MSDVILYGKQKAKLAKAVGKAQKAIADVTLTLAKIGVTPVADDGEPKARKPRAAKAEAKNEKPAKKNGASAFTEM